MRFQLIFIITLCLFCNVAIALPTAKLTIKVVDNKGYPIEGAKVGMVLMIPKNGGVGTTSELVSGLSDSDGLFTGEGETQSHVDLSVVKEGFYGTGGEFDKFTGVSGFIGFRKYVPWNPTLTLVLKKIIDPIAMYAVRTSGGREGEYPEIPVIDEFVGFDLVTNDWVVPYGLGTHRDFLFKVDAVRSTSNRDYDVTFTLKFSNLGDGLIQFKPDISKGKSLMRFPHHVPATGYIDELVQRYENTPGVRKVGSSGNSDFYTNYFFRVRTELDDEGNVVGGLYGKIHGLIELGNYAWLHIEKPYLSFNYYLNPNNNDTNVEYDPEKNLFKGVPHRMRVINP